MRAALERGSRIVVVTPPAPEQLGIWELIGPGTVVVCADPTAALDWVAAAPAGRAVHAVTALPRATRLLKAGAVDVLAGALPDLAALVAASSLKLDAVPQIVLAWPEALVTGDQGAQLDGLLSEAGDARRIVLTWNPALLTEFLERQAPRAAQFGQPPLDPEGRPARAVGGARYVIATPDRRLTALRQILDALDPATLCVWTPDERHAARLRDVLGLAPEVVVTTVPTAPVRLVVCARTPGRDDFAALSHCGPVVLLAAPYQLPYLRSIAAPLEPVDQVAAADAARDRGAQLRARIAARLMHADVDAELSQLAPLFERYEPAEVAAALLALRREDAAASAEPVARTLPGPAWVKLFVTVGKRDKAAAKDLVGAMTRELGVAKEDIGKVDVRDTFSLVDVAGHAAAGVVQGLSRVTIRGKRLTARLDRSS
jgi:hypothetical protein